MDIVENTVWSLMTGGVMALTLMTLVDAALVSRSIGAVRNMLLVSFIGGVCVLMSGLPESLFPNLPQRPLLVCKVALGPLSGALGLRFLGLWIGGAREDRLLYRITVWGSYSLLIASLVLAVLGVLVPPEDYPELLILSGTVMGVAVGLCLLISVRAWLLGDPLALWLVLGCGLLAVMVGGMYLHALQVPGLGLGLWIPTALSSVVFLLISMMLIYVRNQNNRRLARLARLETGSDPVTGLPTGAKLLSEVEHAFWRTGRLRGQCVVVCVYLSNLYELGDTLGRTTDNQILAATAARIRRAAGFRCVVGVYHPRCFVIVFSQERKRSIDEMALARIRHLVTQPLQVVGSKSQRQQFLPQVGISMLAVLPDMVQPLDVINEVEHQAMDQMRRQNPPVAEDSNLDDDRLDTTW